jgi:hypothetical protein
VPEDARGHFLSETGQAQPGTLGEAKPVALKDRRGGETRSSIAGKARRRGTGLPGKRHRRTWKRELEARRFGATRRFKTRSAEG